jgi:hypothetical protein
MKHREMLNKIFQRNSGRKALPGQQAFMSIAEFEEVLQGLSAYDSCFVQRKAATAFMMGMEVQVEECYSSRFQEMTFLEFQHALGAVVYLREGNGGMPHRLEAFFSDQVQRSLEHVSRKPSQEEASP